MIQGIYSFHCDNPMHCYWNSTIYELEVSREAHVMLYVPSSLVENCDCELDDNGSCRCRTGVFGNACDQCMNGYWGFDKDDHTGCKSEF